VSAWFHCHGGCTTMIRCGGGCNARVIRAE
jgi:hypothetical protein